VMFTLMKIWVKNREDFEEEEMIKRFIPVEKSGSVRQDSFIGNVAIQESLTRKIYKVINKGYSTNKFKEFWNENPEENGGN